MEQRFLRRFLRPLQALVRCCLRASRSLVLDSLAEMAPKWCSESAHRDFHFDLVKVHVFCT